MSATVFISHSSKDRQTATTICTALEHRGIDCWISSRDVRPGTNFQESVVQAIRQARVMVLIFTGNANNSDEIKKELVLAGQNRLVVIPVRAEDVVPSDAFAYEFATRQWIDLFDNWERAVEGLVSQVNAVLGEPADVRPRPAGMAASRSARPWNAPLPLAIAAGALVVLAGAIGSVLYFSKPSVNLTMMPVQPVPPSVRSLPSKDDVIIRFVNKTKEPLHLIWIDFIGEEHVYGTIGVGQIFAQPTFAKHVWVTRTLGGREVSRYVATGSSRDFQVDITEN